MRLFWRADFRRGRRARRSRGVEPRKEEPGAVEEVHVQDLERRARSLIS